MKKTQDKRYPHIWHSGSATRRTAEIGCCCGATRRCGMFWALWMWVNAMTAFKAKHAKCKPRSS